jgi:hypothetical protein
MVNGGYRRLTHEMGRGRSQNKDQAQPTGGDFPACRPGSCSTVGYCDLVGKYPGLLFCGGTLSCPTLADVSPVYHLSWPLLPRWCLERCRSGRKRNMIRGTAGVGDLSATGVRTVPRRTLGDSNRPTPQTLPSPPPTTTVSPIRQPQESRVEGIGAETMPRDRIQGDGVGRPHRVLLELRQDSLEPGPRGAARLAPRQRDLR